MKSSFALKTVFIFSMIALTTGSLYAQETKTQKKEEKAAEVKALIDSRNYVFVAQSALPMNGRTRQLTSEYNVTVTADSVVSYLPYFGRAYSAPYGSNKSPLDFKTKQFKYTSTPRKKDGWSISVKPTDQQDIQNINITVSSSGYGTLQVTSNNRQPMSFNGYIKEGKKQ
ncbi:DUF4251 domain-containing protein [Chitinophaga sp. MM2321]|uniref:DUF4251 domain-containing protein n=1 Tax=Chitinophaga sp. MM2321 TaxID=3137178 RepID=UPI0032D56DD8